MKYSATLCACLSVRFTSKVIEVLVYQQAAMRVVAGSERVSIRGSVVVEAQTKSVSPLKATVALPNCARSCAMLNPSTPYKPFHEPVVEASSCEKATVAAGGAPKKMPLTTELPPVPFQ